MNFSEIYWWCEKYGGHMHREATFKSTYLYWNESHIASSLSVCCTTFLIIHSSQIYIVIIGALITNN